MKRLLLLTAIITITIISSCSKSAVNPDDNNPSEFKFVSLTAQDTLLPINGITTVSANATGSGLTYNWKASYGSFIGS